MSMRPWSCPAAGSSSTNCVSIRKGRSQRLRDCRSDRHSISDTGSSNFVSDGGVTALSPGFNDQSQNGGHLGLDETGLHCSGDPMCVIRPPEECMRIVPAISSASFIAAVCVQNRCPIGLTTYSRSRSKTITPRTTSNVACFRGMAFLTRSSKRIKLLSISGIVAAMRARSTFSRMAIPTPTDSDPKVWPRTANGLPFAQPFSISHTRLRYSFCCVFVAGLISVGTLEPCIGSACVLSITTRIVSSTRAFSGGMMSKYSVDQGLDLYTVAATHDPDSINHVRICLSGRFIDDLHNLADNLMAPLRIGMSFRQRKREPEDLLNIYNLATDTPIGRCVKEKIPCK